MNIIAVDDQWAIIVTMKTMLSHDENNAEKN